MSGAIASRGIGIAIKLGFPIAKKVLRFGLRWLKENWETPAGIAGSRLAGTSSVPHSHGSGSPTGDVHGGIGGGSLGAASQQGKKKLWYASRRQHKKLRTVFIKRQSWSKSYPRSRRYV